MPLTLRPGRPEDATMCGTICYEAFKTIAEQHNFPPSYTSPEVAVARMAERLTHPGFYAVVAEWDGRIGGVDSVHYPGYHAAIRHGWSHPRASAYSRRSPARTGRLQGL